MKGICCIVLTESHVYFSARLNKCVEVSACERTPFTSNLNISHLNSYLSS